MVPSAPVGIFCFISAIYELIPKGSDFPEIQKGKVIKSGGRGGKKDHKIEDKNGISHLFDGQRGTSLVKNEI